MIFPEIGELAPNFTLLNQDGEKIELKSFRGIKNVVVYFYPRASTPGCTTQACAIRDSKDDFDAIGTMVLGVSPDSPLKLKKFYSKYNLGFTILSDDTHDVAGAYGVWALKNFMGKQFMGIIRTTFIIDINGYLRHIIAKVNTKTHNLDAIHYIKDNF
ncbi:MAG: thioredoxin-dependent thiol peroxidase [Pseudomonadota bacterium]